MMLWAVQVLGVAGLARGATPDAADLARAWLIDEGHVAVSEPLKLWYHVDLPVKGLRIVHLRVVRQGQETGGWTCFADEDDGSGPWCEPESRFADVVGHYQLGQGAARLTDFDWLRFLQLSEGGACGDASDLQRLDPTVHRRVLRLVGDPQVERPDEGGVQLNIACLVEGVPHQVEVVVSAANAVTVERRPLTP